ncbi:MAG: nucleotide exchange factor GrpE [Halobacteriales archaeon]
MSDDGDPAAEQPPNRDGDDQDGPAATDQRTADGDADADADAEAADAVADAAHDRLPVEAAIADQVADYDESLADDVAVLFETATDLADRVDDLEEKLQARSEEVEDLESRLKRKQADFENYKKRRQREEERIRERATEDLVDRLLDVRDDLVRAVGSDHDDVEGLRDGVKMTLEEFDRVLDAENVAAVEPEPGDEVDPQRHEVMMRVESDRPEGTVA